MRTALCLSVFAVFLALSKPALADDKEDCSSKDVDRVIRGCTGVINSSQDLKKPLAVAYHRRGTAYALKKDYDKAIADYTKAIEIHPAYVSAYNDRALAFTSKGDYANAVADVTKAVELTPKAASRSTTLAATPGPSASTASSPKTSTIAKARGPEHAKAMKSAPTSSETPVIPKWAEPISEIWRKHPN